MGKLTQVVGKVLDLRAQGKIEGEPVDLVAAANSIIAEILETVPCG